MSLIIVRDRGLIITGKIGNAEVISSYCTIWRHNGLLIGFDNVDNKDYTIKKFIVA